MSSTDVNEAKKARQAAHALIDANGVEVEDEESATGIRYTLLANQQAFEYQVGKHPDADRMLALFGAKTLATNEASQVRNNPKGNAGADAQIAAVRDRFALLQTLPHGRWIGDREPGFAAVNEDALVRAIVTYAQENGKALDDAGVIALKQKVAEGVGPTATPEAKAYVRGVRNHTRIGALYAVETGKPQISDADVFAGIGTGS